MLAILAPYDRSETTLAALRVADLAVQSGIDLTYLAAGTKGQGIHRYWDSRVVTRPGLPKLAKLLPGKFKHIISFGLQPLQAFEKLPKMGIVDKTAFHDIVITPYDLRREETCNWASAQRVICPSESTYKLAQTASYMGHGRITIQKLLWATGDQSYPTDAISDALSFAAVCDSACLREYPEIWLHTVGQFLRGSTGHKVCCYLNCSLPRRARSMLRELMGQYEERFSIQTPLPVQDLIVWLRDHDIAVYPSCRTVFGMYPAIFKGINMPFLAMKLSPVDEMAPDMIHSCLVEMPSFVETNGVDRGMFDANRWLEAWYAIAADPGLLFSKQEPADMLRLQSNAAFRMFWKTSWQATITA